MMRPARLVEEQVGLALGMHYGGRGHGASAPRLHGGVRHLIASRSSLLFMVTWIGGADHVRCGGIRLPAQGVDALRWSEVQASICLSPGEAFAADLHLNANRRD